MSRRILHLLSQRPGRTGSGVTLDSLVRFSAKAGWEQAAALGTPAEDPQPDLGDVDRESVHPLIFESGDLDFPVPGMSDVMPYPSTRFSDMDADALARYRHAWRELLKEVIGSFRPDLIHSHHLWLLSSMVKDLAPDLPLLIQCHATGLRQLELCPLLAGEVLAGCARADRFQVLSSAHAIRLSDCLGVGLDRIHVIPSGYREDLFHRRGRSGDWSERILYVGKLSRAKGLPWLLDAFERLRDERSSIQLHVAGSGGGAEAENLERRMTGMAGAVFHGMLGQEALGALMRRSEICVLPSFYEGVPLVLVEALACGCKLLSTDLPGVRDRIAPAAGPALRTLPLPGLKNVDEPREEDLPAFVENLARGLALALDAPAPEAAELDEFGWRAVFRRTETIWKELLS